jgi:pyridoxine kinase
MEDGKILTHAIRVSKIEGYFSGVGDLFSALVCGHYRPAVPAPQNPSPGTGFGIANGFSLSLDKKPAPQTLISQATYFALLKTVHILRATRDHYVSVYSKDEEINMTDEEKDRFDPMRVVRRMRRRELRLVQCQDVLRRRVLGEFGMRVIGDDGMIYWEDLWD